MKKALVFGTVLSATLMMSIGAIAWACTRQPTILALDPQVGQPGSTVMVEGVAAPNPLLQGTEAQRPVEVRWNGLEGPRLAEVKTSESGRFAVSVQIPSVEPDVYFLVVVDGEGTVARHAFAVTGRAPSNSSPTTGPNSAAVRPNTSVDLWEGFSSAEPTLSDPAATPVSESRPLHLAGLGLFALGLASASAGMTYVVASRRRGKELAGGPNA